MSNRNLVQWEVLPTIVGVSDRPNLFQKLLCILWSDRRVFDEAEAVDSLSIVSFKFLRVANAPYNVS